MTPEIQQPEPIMTGRFNLFETQGGGFHIAYLPDGENQETQHIDIPAAIINAAKMAAQGKLNPFKMMRGMLGNGSDDAADS